MSSDKTLPPLPSPHPKQLGLSSYNKNITLCFNLAWIRALQGCLYQVKLDLTEIETSSRRCQVPYGTEPPVSLSRGPQALN